MRPHPRVELTETVDAAGRGQALSQAYRRQASVRRGVQATLVTGPSEGVGQVDQSSNGCIQTNKVLVRSQTASLQVARSRIALDQAKSQTETLHYSAPFPASFPTTPSSAAAVRPPLHSGPGGPTSIISTAPHTRPPIPRPLYVEPPCMLVAPKKRSGRRCRSWSTGQRHAATTFGDSRVGKSCPRGRFRERTCAHSIRLL